MSYTQAVGMSQNFSVVHKSTRGFTLLELVVVLAVLSILLVMAIPNTSSRVTREQIAESQELIRMFKQQLADLYLEEHKLPEDNADAGFPKPEKWIGNYVERIDYKNGAFTFRFGNKAHPRIAHKRLSIRPILVIGSPESPISWVCGNAKVPEGMSARGANETNIEPVYLPYGCF